MFARENCSHITLFYYVSTTYALYQSAIHIVMKGKTIHLKIRRVKCLMTLIMSVKK